MKQISGCWELMVEWEVIANGHGFLWAQAQWKCFKIRLWSWLHNSVNVLEIIELDLVSLMINKQYPQ